MAKSARRFQYNQRSRDDVKKRANMRGGGFDSYIKSEYKKYKIKDGKNTIRVMPPTWEGAGHYGFDIWVNYNLGADNQSYLSLGKMGKGRDPVEEMRAQANREGDEELAKALQPRQRILMWIIDRQEEDEGPQIFDCPFTLDKALANISLDDDTREVKYIDDPENGFDFRFYKEGSGLKTDYDASRMKLLESTPLCEDEKLQAEWLEYIENNPIPDCVQFYSYEHIAQVANGTASAKDEEAEDDEKVARRRRSRDDDESKSHVRRKVELDDEDEKPKRARRASVDEDDDEPEDKPARKRVARDDDDNEAPRRRRVASKDDDDPELPFETDEPEEEEKPKKRGRGAEDDEDSIGERLRRRREALKE